jgi:predicted permease
MTPRRVYRWLLRLYPAPFRRRFGRDMQDLFVDRLSAARGRGRVAYLTELALAAADAVSQALHERRRAGAGRTGMPSSVMQDIRVGLRALVRSPGFSALATLSLALGVGATTALYGAARVALIDDMPVPHPDQLKLVYWSAPGDLAVSQYYSGGYRDPATGRSYRSNYSYPVFKQLADPHGDRLFGFNFLARLTGSFDGRVPVSLAGLLVSGNAFSILQPAVAVGRGLNPADDDVASPPVVVLTDDGWRAIFGAEPAAPGKILRLNGSPFTVVGVTARGFRGLSTGGGNSPLAHVILPMSAQPQVWAVAGGPSLTTTTVLWVRVMMRLGDADAATTARQLASGASAGFVTSGIMTPAQGRDLDVLLRPGRRGIDPIAANAERPLRILAATIGVVLLIACVNLAALLLARGVTRQREIALRQALGAGRLRIIRQLTIEHAVLAAAGGTVGLLVALWARPAVASMLTVGLGVPPTTVAMDWRTVAVALAATGVTALLFGLLPAIRLTSRDLMGGLRQQMIAANAPRLRLGRALLIAQIAASLPLIVLALLLLRTLARLTAVEIGFDPRGLMTVRVDPTLAPGFKDDRPELERLGRRLLDRVEAIPGVVSATLIENPLLSGITSNNWVYVDGEKKSMYMNGVGPKYFETIGVALVAGRAPSIDDHAEGPRVAVVNETAVRTIFGGAPPIGRRFTMGRHDYEVIGVARDMKSVTLREPDEPTFMDPFVQRAAGGPMTVLLRARVLDEPLKAAVRSAVADVMPEVPIGAMRTQVEQIARNSGRERLLTELLAFFAGFVLLLASVGLYSATSYSVARRTSEIGVRIALGAARSDVVWMVIRSVLTVSAAGLVFGSVAAWFAGPLAGQLLFELEPRDAPTLGLAAAVMLMVSIAAGALPAARASRIEPLVALRRE